MHLMIPSFIFFTLLFPSVYYAYPITPRRGVQSRNAYFFFASPSGKMILNTKKKITMDTPPVMIVTRIL